MGKGIALPLAISPSSFSAEGRFTSDYRKNRGNAKRKAVMALILFVFVSNFSFSQSLEVFAMLNFETAPLSLSLHTQNLETLNRHNGQFHVIVEEGSEDAWRKIREAYNLRPIEAEIMTHYQISRAIVLNLRSGARILFLVGSNNPAGCPTHYSGEVNSRWVGVMNDPQRILWTSEAREAWENAQRSRRIIE